MSQRTIDTEANQKKLRLLDQTIIRLQGEVLRKGIYGTFAIEFDCNDGTIKDIRTVRKESQRHEISENVLATAPESV